MTIPGTDLERDETPDPQLLDQGAAPPAVEEEDDDSLIETTTIGSQKMAPVGDVIRFRKEARELKKQNAELNAKIEWAKTVEQRLNEVTPTLDLIRQHPQIVEQVQQGTRASNTNTPQPQDDREAQEWAEENGLITAAGELDIARARRQLDRLDARAAKMAEQAVGPIRQNNAQQVSAQHRTQAKGVTLQDGTKFATDESIDQAFSMLPAELTADPKVAAIIPLIAAGLDRAKGKTLRAASRDESEPLLTESVGRRGPAAISPDLQRILQRTGVTEKEFRETNYVPGRPMRLE
jgi:hypothetical protein